MKLLLLCACIVVVAYAKPQSEALQRLRPRGYSGYYGGRSFRPVVFQRSAADLVAMFPGIDHEIAAAIADKLIAAGIDKAMMQTTIAGTTQQNIWTAATIVADAVGAIVPAGCTEAMAVHMVAGFARRIVMEALVKDFIHVVEECTEREHLGAGGEGRMAGVAECAPSLAQWNAVVTAINDGMNAKLAAWIPETANVNMKAFFDAIMITIDTGFLKDGTVADVCAMIAKTHMDFLGMFTGTATTCDVGGTFADLAAHSNDLANFMKVDAINLLANIDVPVNARPIIISKLTMTLGIVATRLTAIVNAYHTGGVTGFMTIIRKEQFDEVIIATQINGMMNGIMTADFMNFVNGKIAAGQIENVLKMLLKTVALTMADMDISQPGIESLLTVVVRTIMAEADFIKQRQLFPFFGW